MNIRRQTCKINTISAVKLSKKADSFAIFRETAIPAEVGIQFE